MVRDYSRSEISAAIDEWILNEKHRAMLKRKLIDGVTYERLAEEFGFSPRWTKELVYRLKVKLYKHL